MPNPEPMTTLERTQMRTALWTALVLAFVWANGAWFFTRHVRLIFEPSIADYLGDFGNLCAFNGLVCFTLVCLLGTRNHIIERAFGLDAMLLTHRRLGQATVALFIGHAITRTWSISLKDGRFYDPALLYTISFAPDEWALTLGRLTLLGMLVLTALALAGQKYHRLRYTTWKVPHFGFYLLFVAGLVHGVFYGNDMTTWAFIPYWVVLAIVFVADSAARLGYRVGRDERLRWRVTEVERESKDTVSFYLDKSGDHGAMDMREAGQFAVIRIPAVPELNEPHPFTFSGAAHVHDPRLRFTIKTLGDFTTRIHEVLPGTDVVCEGPYGIFGADFMEHPHVGFIAGGVGITPFLSMLRTVRAHHGKGHPPTHVSLTLVWAGKTCAELFDVDELIAMTDEIPLTLHLAVSRERAKDLPASSERVIFHAGRVDAPVVRAAFSGRERFYMCGPSAFMDTTLWLLEQERGVASDRVSRELFFW